MGSSKREIEAASKEFDAAKDRVRQAKRGGNEEEVELAKMAQERAEWHLQHVTRPSGF